MVVLLTVIGADVTIAVMVVSSDSVVVGDAVAVLVVGDSVCVSDDLVSLVEANESLSNSVGDRDESLAGVVVVMMAAMELVAVLGKKVFSNSAGVVVNCDCDVAG